MQQPDPTFPPLLTGHDVKGDAQPFERACDEARAGRLGAGDVVWSRNTSRLDMAIILEPEVPLSRSVEMLPLAMVALGDCLGVLTPPQVAVMFRWPGVVTINGGVAGEVKAACGGAESASDVPDWLVIGVWLRHRREPRDPEPGETPDITWLAEEGGGELTRTDLIESYSRHFLAWLNGWQDEGFRQVHEQWFFRAEGRNEEITVPTGDGQASGLFTGLDESGNLLLKGDDGSTRAEMLIDHFERHPAAVRG